MTKATRFAIILISIIVLLSINVAAVLMNVTDQLYFTFDNYDGSSSVGRGYTFKYIGTEDTYLIGISYNFEPNNFPTRFRFYSGSKAVLTECPGLPDYQQTLTTPSNIIAVDSIILTTPQLLQAGNTYTVCFDDNGAAWQSGYNSVASLGNISKNPLGSSGLINYTRSFRGSVDDTTVRAVSGLVIQKNVTLIATANPTINLTGKNVLFYDDYNRANTYVGSLGNSINPNSSYVSWYGGVPFYTVGIQDNAFRMTKGASQNAYSARVKSNINNSINEFNSSLDIKVRLKFFANFTDTKNYSIYVAFNNYSSSSENGALGIQGYTLFNGYAGRKLQVSYYPNTTQFTVGANLITFFNSSSYTIDITYASGLSYIKSYIINGYEYVNPEIDRIFGTGTNTSYTNPSNLSLESLEFWVGPAEVSFTTLYDEIIVYQEPAPIPYAVISSITPNPLLINYSAIKGYCQPNQNSTAFNYSWYKNNTLLTSGVTSGSYTANTNYLVNSLSTIIENGATYRFDCIAYNGSAYSTTSTISLIATNIINGELMFLNNYTMFYYSMDQDTTNGTHIRNLVNNFSSIYNNTIQNFSSYKAIYNNSVFNISRTSNETTGGWTTNIEYDDKPNMTMSVWYYPTLFGAGSNLLSNDCGAFCGIGLYVNATGHPYLHDCYPPSNCDDFRSTGNLTLNQWNHIVVTIKTSNITFYINNQVKGSLAQTLTNHPNAVNWSVMKSNPSSANSADGYVDEVAFMNVTINASIVSALYGAGPTGFIQSQQYPFGLIVNNATSLTAINVTTQILPSILYTNTTLQGYCTPIGDNTNLTLSYKLLNENMTNIVSNAVSDLTYLISAPSVVYLEYDNNSNLVYNAGSAATFSVFNQNTGGWASLANTDTGGWATGTVTAMGYNYNQQLLYTGGANGQFGVYNKSNNIWSDLSATDTGDWVGASVFTSSGLIYSSIDNLIYTGLNGGKFGVYNISNNVWSDLSATDTDNWFNISSPKLAYDNINNLIYLKLGLVNFGVYNINTNISTLLSTTLPGTFITYDSQRDLIYSVGGSGGFYVYNVSSNSWANLSDTDVSNWIGTTNLLGVNYDENTGLIYFVGGSGKFGVYDINTNISTQINTSWSSTLNDLTVGNNGDIFLGGTSPVKFGVYTNIGKIYNATSGTNYNVINYTLTANNYNQNVSLYCDATNAYNSTGFITSELGKKINDLITYNMSSFTDNSVPGLFPEIGDTINLNSSVTSRDIINICQLQTNVTGTWITSQNQTVNSVGTNLNVPFTYTVTNNSNANNSVVYWRAICNDTFGTQFQSQSASFNVTDLRFPLIIIGPGALNINSNNRTVFSRDKYNLTFNITYFDYNLFAMEINVSCDIDGQLYYFTNSSIGLQNYTVAGQVPLNNASFQKCNFFTAASDSHTDEETPEYEFEKLDNGLSFLTENNNIVQIITENSTVDNVDTTKLVDRQTFEFEFADTTNTRTFKVLSDKPLYYIEDSIYPAHFIAWNQQTFTGNWIDFVDQLNTADTYVVNKINDYEYDVIITTIIPTNKMSFASIGGTTITNFTLDFYIGGDINVNSNNTYDGSRIAGFNYQLITTDGVNNYTGWINGNGTIQNVSAGTYNITFSNSTFFGNTVVTSLSNVSANVTYYGFQNQYNFIFRNVKTLLPIYNVSYTIRNLITGWNTTGNTGSSSPLIKYLNNGTYNITWNASGYDTMTQMFTASVLENITLTYDTSFLASFILYDEKRSTLTGSNVLFNVANATSISFLLFCPGETRAQIINSTNFTVPITCNYNLFEFLLTYGTSSYYRAFIIEPDDAFNVDIYLIDLSTTPYLFNSLVADDLLSKYINPRIFVKKVIGNKTVQITANFVDIEQKIGAFLIENNQYIVEIYSDNLPVYVIGTYFADAAGTKSIRLYDVSIYSRTAGTSQPNIGQITVINASEPNSTLFYRYQDDTNLTTSVNFNVYQNNNPVPICTDTLLSNNNLLVACPITSYNSSKITVEQTITRAGQTSTIKQVIKDITEIQLGIIQYFGQAQINWFLIIVIASLALFGTIQTANIYTLALVGIAVLFNVFGWLVMSTSVLAFAVMVALIAIFKEGDKVN